MHIFHTERGRAFSPHCCDVCDVYLNSYISCNSKILSASSYKQKGVQLPVATKTDVQH